MDDEARLLALLEALYGAAARPEEWPRFLELLSERFAAEVVGFAHYDTEGPRHAINSCVGLGPREIRHYEEHFSSRNIWVNRGRDEIAAGGVLIGEQLCPQPDLVRSEYYNDFLRKSGVGHLMAAVLAEAPQRFTGLSILRSERRGTFERDEVMLLERVLPHLKRVVQLHGRIGGMKPEAQPLACVVDQLSEGLIILDARGRAIFLNRVARSIVSRNDFLALGPNGIRLRSPSHDARLQSLLASVVGPRSLGGDSGGAVAVPRAPPQPPLLLLITPARPRAGWTDSRRAAVLLWIRAPEHASAWEAAWARRAFGLSAAEARLAETVICGQSLAQASDRLGISRHTARSHLKSVLDKTGTRRQSDLVRVWRAPSRFGGPTEAPRAAAP
jgi:DNA-binding CsgD family transcriptional regulator